jgi:hypothetical protein
VVFDVVLVRLYGFKDWQRHGFFNLQVRWPTRRPLIFITASIIYPAPSGVVPGGGAGGCALQNEIGGEGPNCNLQLEFRALFVIF